ncbi:MAG: FAD:protein FMN transferase [Alphaproteobacteria bacterium]
MTALNRRRLLTVIAAAGTALLPGNGRTATVPRWRWRGTALGARAEIILVHPDEATAQELIRLAIGEIERLENIFSLYRPESEISRLNRDGLLEMPSAEMTALMSTARHVSTLTGGAFDVTVQPLWRLHAEHFARPDADPDGPSPAAIAAARRLVDYRAMDISPSMIRFARPGMGVTLNGIAQGYITDRVADLLRAHGIENTLVDLGEIRTLGSRPDRRPWRVAIEGAPAGPLDLTDRAIATSSPAGTRFDRRGQFHHLFDPATGRPSTTKKPVSVIAKRATFADALSTALLAMPADRRITWQHGRLDVVVVG